MQGLEGKSGVKKQLQKGRMSAVTEVCIEVPCRPKGGKGGLGGTGEMIPWLCLEGFGRNPLGG